MTTLAVKPTRREIIKIVLDVAREKATTKSRALAIEASRLGNAWHTANARIGEIAKEYADKRYSKLIGRLRKLIEPEFPGADISITMDMERDDKSRFKPDGKATVRLGVYSSGKQEVDLPAEVRAEMEAANAESQRLAQETTAALHRDREYRTEVQQMFGGSDFANYQRLLVDLLPTLGDEAAGHLDALIGMVEKALEVKQPASS